MLAVPSRSIISSPAIVDSESLEHFSGGVHPGLQQFGPALQKGWAPAKARSRSLDSSAQRGLARDDNVAAGFMGQCPTLKCEGWGTRKG